MPLRDGNLRGLIMRENIPDYRGVFFNVLGQMLSALDYLDSEGLVHRDVKPDNILYYVEDEEYVFQLADFGLAHHEPRATTRCGTYHYHAPELHPELSEVKARQSHKMDVWSLFATMTAVNRRFRGFPPVTNDYRTIVGELQAEAASSPLEAMARLHPDDRASAAQMLVVEFNGWGLTTRRSKVGRIKPKARNATLNPWLATVPGPSNHPQLINYVGQPETNIGAARATANPPVVALRVHGAPETGEGCGRACQRQPNLHPLTTYPPRPPSQSHSPRPRGSVNRDGVTKRRAKTPVSRRPKDSAGIDEKLAREVFHVPPTPTPYSLNAPDFYT
jgi:serine/threonine protein kinase